jgi:hypothetical protein
LLVVRTYFGPDGDWDAFVREATDAYDPRGFAAFFVPVSDVQYEGLQPEELPDLTAEYTRAVCAADAESMLGPVKTVIVVGCLRGDRGRWFRVPLPLAWEIENNLRLANADFDDYARYAVDGVYRGLPEPGPQR